MKLVIRFAFCAAFCALLATASRARAGWLSNLNPFASKSSGDEAEKSDAKPGSTASLDSALGSSHFDSRTPAGASASTSSVQTLNGKPIHPVNSVTPAAPSGPSLLSRIGSAPANLFAKTKGLFSKSSAPAPAAQTRMLGKPSGGSMFTRSGSSAVRQQSTASQFLGRPRPGF